MIDGMGHVHQLVATVYDLRLRADGLLGLRFVVGIRSLLSFKGATGKVGARGMRLPAIGQGYLQVSARNLDDSRNLGVERGSAGVAYMGVAQDAVVTMVVGELSDLRRV